MRQATGDHPHVGSRAVLSHHGPIEVYPTRRRRSGFTPQDLFHNLRGFTLIELVVAMAILLVVMIGVMSSVAFAYTSSNDTEMSNIAKNVATYTIEYLRARTVTNDTHNTTLYNLLNPSGSPSTGTYRWYDPTTNPYGALPSMIDVGNLPLQSDGYPCNYTSASVRTKIDGNPNPGTGGGIGAGGVALKFASKHAALPTDTYATSSTPSPSLAWTTTLQGYVSVLDTSALGTTLNPATEDKNVARIALSGDSPATGTYRTLLTSKWTGLIVRYPGVCLTATGITSFTPGSTYAPMVYTTDAGKVKTTTPNPEYNPYYTNDITKKAATQNYRGFRVLTQVVARSAVASLDLNNCRHVQYYDVTVTVLWMNGTREGTYELASRIVAY